MPTPRTLLAIICCALMIGAPAGAAQARRAARPHPHTHSRSHRRPRPHHSGIPQRNGGDHDSDNNGGPSDGDGNV